MKRVTSNPLWLLDIQKPKALLVVTHADDETIFAGGLILSSREVSWTIICVNPQSQQRKEEFLSACHFLAEKSGNQINSILLDTVLNPNGQINVNWLISKLKSHRVRYNFVLTHNREGEYGNENHKLVHRCVIKSVANPNTWLFISPGSTNVNQEILKSKHLQGNVTLAVNPEILKLKIQAFQECHKSQAKLYGYDSISRKLRDSHLRETLQWEFESGKEQYTFYI